MEKGIIRSYDKNCGMGMISRVSDKDLRFYAASIIGGDRVRLSPGDSVSFEIHNIKNLHIAINVEKA